MCRVTGLPSHGSRKLCSVELKNSRRMSMAWVLSGDLLSSVGMTVVCES
jgi:hypothetical protein